MDGTLIAGRYRRRERLGAGGMASVWSARDERTGRDVAVKVLHPHLAGDDRQRGRLRHEAAALASIDDAHVVPVLDVIEDGDMAAIVMPRVEGTTLADRLAEAGAMSEPEALDVAIAVAEALAAAHAVGLVHRDVKPSNILIGWDGVVRLMDFGIAADLDATTELTVEGVIGTLRYLAPERLLGEPAVPATDVWGVGVVLLEMLTGRPVYPGGGLGERLDAAGDPVARPAAASDATWAVIQRAADGDPGRRFADGAGLLAALRDARRAIAGSVSDAATVVVPIPAAVVGTGHAQTPVEADPQDEPIAGRPAAAAPPARSSSSGRRRPGAIAAALAVVLVAVAGLAVVAMDPGPGDAPATKVAAAAPPASEPSASPTLEPSPAPAAADDEPKGKANGKGNGKGKGKDKP
jgi:serine/threonine protein kinase